MQVMSTTNKVVIDIETIGEDFDTLDKATRENLTRWIKRDSDNEDEYKLALEDLKNGLGFRRSPGRSSRSAFWMRKKMREPSIIRRRGRKIRS